MVSFLETIYHKCLPANLLENRDLKHSALPLKTVSPYSK